MKKKNLLVLIIVFLLSFFSLCLISCDTNNTDNTDNETNTNDTSTSHTCVYSEKITSDTYKVSNATCTEKAKYYFSCTCGKKGTETFEYGTELGHDFINYVYNNDATCVQDGTKTAVCIREDCTHQDTVVAEGTRLIEISAYVDGEFFGTLYTCENKDYKINFPERPQDITTNRNIEKYFYGWFLDEFCENIINENQTFKTNSKIYAKWIKTDSSIFNYTVSNGKATITGRKNKNSFQPVLVIPGYINTFQVSTIGKSAFIRDDMLEKVIICENLETIEGAAFYECSRLEEIIIPESITCMKKIAFGSCPKLTKIFFNAIHCIVMDCGYIDGGVKWNTNGHCPYGYGAAIEEIEIFIGENVKFIDNNMFSDPVGIKYKTTYFKNPYGWYRYTDPNYPEWNKCYAIENISNEFILNTYYGKELMGELVK